MKKAKEKVKKHPEWSTSAKERAIYIMGDCGRAFNVNIFGILMVTFLMLQGINIAGLAVVTLVIKIIDSVDDVIIGFLIDKVDITKTKFFRRILGQGKFLPWFRLTFLPLPLVIIAFYMMPDGISQTGKVIWYVVTYLLYDLVYTLCEVPMNSLIMTLTGNMEERRHIQTVKAMITVISAIVSLLPSFLISEFVGAPVRIVGIIFAIIFALLTVPFAVTGKEYNTELVNVEENEEEKYSIKEMFSCLKGNRDLLLYLLSTLVMTTLQNLGTSMALFIGFYFFQNSQVASISGLIIFIPSILLMTQAGRINEKFGGSRKTMMFMCFFIGIVNFTVFLVGRNNMFLYIAVNIIAALPSSVLGVIRSFAMPNLIEYTKYTKGQDCSGIFFSLLSFVNKVTSSIGSSLGMFILGMFGWVSVQATDFADLAAQNVAQSELALNTLWSLATLFPAIGCILGGLLLVIYRLDDKDAQLMSDCNAGKITRAECQAKLSRKY